MLIEVALPITFLSLLNGGINTEKISQDVLSTLAHIVESEDKLNGELHALRSNKQDYIIQNLSVLVENGIVKVQLDRNRLGIPKPRQ